MTNLCETSWPITNETEAGGSGISDEFVIITNLAFVYLLRTASSLLSINIHLHRLSCSCGLVHTRDCMIKLNCLRYKGPGGHD